MTECSRAYAALCNHFEQEFAVRQDRHCINIEVLNAEQQLYAVPRDWHNARADTLVQGLRLKAASATLAETELIANNHSLEAEQP